MTLMPLSTEKNLEFSNTTILFGGDEYFPPFEYIDSNGVYKGFNVDIIRAIAIEMGLDVEIQPMTWKNTLVALKKGDIDAIQNRDAFANI